MQHPTQTPEQQRHECVLQRDGAIKWLENLRTTNPDEFARQEKGMLEHIACFQRTIDWIDNPPKLYPGMFGHPQKFSGTNLTLDS